MLNIGAEGEWEGPPSDRQQAVDRDAEIVSRWLETSAVRPHLRIWSNRRALVVPRSFRHRRGFEAAVRASPVPVVLRQSGGTAVMHGPHVLNASLAIAADRNSPPRLNDAFGALGAAVFKALAAFGVTASFENVAGCHCPGRFTIASGGRKLAGTAAFVREKGARRVILVHSNLVLAQHPEDLPVLSSFERRIGLSAQYLASAHTSLADLLGGRDPGRQTIDQRVIGI